MITLDGIPPSAKIRADLATEGRPVLLAFSRGKDSIATWLALRASGVEVIPFHLYRIPDVRFEAESLAYFEETFGQPILRLPHPWLYSALADYVYQPPERCGVIEAAQLPRYSYEWLCDQIRAEMGLPADTWVCEGVRACDSAVRRIAIKTHGAMRPNSGHKCSAIWDWQVADVRSAIAEAGIDLPVDYELFGRSFDGIDLRFMGPLRDRFPEDYERVREWFPLIDLLFVRENLGVAA